MGISTKLKAEKRKSTDMTVNTTKKRPRKKMSSYEMAKSRYFDDAPKIKKENVIKKEIKREREPSAEKSEVILNISCDIDEFNIAIQEESEEKVLYDSPVIEEYTEEEINKHLEEAALRNNNANTASTSKETKTTKKKK